MLPEYIAVVLQWASDKDTDRFYTRKYTFKIDTK